MRTERSRENEDDDMTLKGLSDESVGQEILFYYKFTLGEYYLYIVIDLQLGTTNPETLNP